MAILLSIQELLSHPCTGAGTGRREGKRRAGNVPHPAWPSYPHPLTKTLGRALQPAQLSMDAPTLAELPHLYPFFAFMTEGINIHIHYKPSGSLVGGESLSGDILESHGVWIYMSLCVT